MLSASGTNITWSFLIFLVGNWQLSLHYLSLPHCLLARKAGAWGNQKSLWRPHLHIFASSSWPKSDFFLKICVQGLDGRVDAAQPSAGPKFATRRPVPAWQPIDSSFSPLDAGNWPSQLSRIQKARNWIPEWQDLTWASLKMDERGIWMEYNGIIWMDMLNIDIAYIYNYIYIIIYIYIYY